MIRLTKDELYEAIRISHRTGAAYAEAKAFIRRMKEEEQEQELLNKNKEKERCKTVS